MKSTTDSDPTAADTIICDVFIDTYDISDDALEAAARAEERQGMTGANCTAVWWCWPFVSERC